MVEESPYPIVPYCTAEHLPSVQKWWATIYKGQRFPSVCVPPTGAVALHRNRPGAACFVYLTNCSLAIIAFAVADPEIPPSRRIAVIREAVRGAIDVARSHVGEIGVIWSCTDNAVVARVYSELGLHNPGGTTADVFYLPVGDVPTGFLE